MNNPKVVVLASTMIPIEIGEPHSGKDPAIPININAAISRQNVCSEVPALAFGLYKVPNGDEGVRIIKDAILRAGYRHLDSASIYGNEKTLGKALNHCFETMKDVSDGDSKQKVLKRSELFLASKVWNDAQREGRPTVRRSVEQSLNDLGLDYLDICYVHWPVPGCFVETYRELLLLQKEEKIKFLGISNFRIADYEELLKEVPPNEFVPPLIHQFEISPFMYRPKTVQYFAEKKILVAASKALNRTVGLDSEDGEVVRDIAKSHSVTPAQVLLRWSYQNGLIVLTKTTSLSRMNENRSLFDFSLSPLEMDQLDGITKEEAVRAREELEAKRRSS